MQSRSKEQTTTNLVDVLKNRRLHVEIVGEEWGEDAAGNNQSSISFHSALNQAVVRRTHKPKRLQADNDGQSQCHSESQVHPSCYRGEWDCLLLPWGKTLCTLYSETRNPDSQSEKFWIKQLLLVQCCGINFFSSGNHINSLWFFLQVMEHRSIYTLSCFESQRPRAKDFYSISHIIDPGQSPAPNMRHTHESKHAFHILPWNE